LYGKTEKLPGKRVDFVLRMPGIGIVGKRLTSAKFAEKILALTFYQCRSGSSLTRIRRIHLRFVRRRTQGSACEHTQSATPDRPVNAQCALIYTINEFVLD
jgi:hypothetical protein